MRNYNAVNKIRQIATLRDEWEVGEATFVIVAHMHATIQNNVFTSDLTQNTAPSYILSSTQRSDEDFLLHSTSFSITNKNLIRKEMERSIGQPIRIGEEFNFSFSTPTIKFTY